MKDCSWNSKFKSGIEIFVGQAVFKLQIKTVKMLFLDHELKNCLAYLNFDAIFWVPWTIYYKMHILFF